MEGDKPCSEIISAFGRMTGNQRISSEPVRTPKANEIGMMQLATPKTSRQRFGDDAVEASVVAPFCANRTVRRVIQIESQTIDHTSVFEAFK
eukprot:scaffold655_cov379-Prasinococcus_capsulatus_cf.AAC.21